MSIPTLPDGRIPVLLSAHAEDLLAADAAAIAGYLGAHRGAATVAEVAAALLGTRRIRRHRAVIRARDHRELREALAAAAAGTEHPRVARSARTAAPRVAFVFPGQGGQHPGMGAASDALPGYRAAVDRCCEAFAAAGHPTPRRYLMGTDPQHYTEIEVQGAQFSHAVALAEAWRAGGVRADLVVGHSLGEIAAAHVAGALTLADAVGVVAARAGVVDRLPGRYAVAALGMTAAEAMALIAETPGWLELSVINADGAVAVSGDRAAVTAAVATARGRGRLGREITVNFPVHTSVLEPLGDWVRANLPAGEFAEAAVEVIGASTGDVVAAGTAFGDYWYANLRNTVRFDRAVATAIRRGAEVFVEISSHPALLHAVAAQAGDGALLVGTGRRDTEPADEFSANLARVAVADPGHRWYPAPGPRRLPGLPNAPMRADRLWAQRRPLPPVPALTITAERWLPAPAEPAPAQGPRRIAVLELGVGAAVAQQADAQPAAAQPALAERLAAALGSHPGAVAAEPTDADTLVLLAPRHPEPDPEHAVGVLEHLVAGGLLDYPAAIGPACRNIWLVTAGAEQVTGADPLLPLPAALAAIHRSLGLEHPELNFAHLDLPEQPPAPAAVLGALLGAPGEVALRVDGAGQTRCYRRELGAFDGPALHAPALPTDTGLLDEVVITGGSGAVARGFTEQLAERGARRIVLLSRRPADPDWCAALTARYGTDIRPVSADLTDPDALRAAAAAHAGTGATLVVHAAGAATFGPAADLDDTAFAHTLAAKTTGLAELTRCWPLARDARVLLCSSMSAVCGGHGHAAYAAANRLLDVAAARLRAAGIGCVSVRWGLWQTPAGGIVDAAETARIQRSGLRPMAPAAAVDAGLCDYRVDPLILVADPDRLRIFLGCAPEPAPAPAPEPAAAPAPGPAAGTDPAALVRAELAAVCSLPGPGAVDLGAALFDLGVDSLLALELRKRLTRGCGHTVPLARLLGGITGADLVGDLRAAASRGANGTESDTPRD